MDIQFIMKDFKQWEVGKPNYPNMNPYQYSIDLLPIDITKKWIVYKLMDLQKIIETGVLPLCTDVQLWRDPPKFKVYKDEASVRALPKGTFDNMADANDFSNRRKIPGNVRMIPSVPKRCNYCSVRNVCTQYEGFILAGLLERID